MKILATIIISIVKFIFIVNIINVFLNWKDRWWRRDKYFFKNWLWHTIIMLCLTAIIGLALWGVWV